MIDDIERAAGDAQSGLFTEGDANAFYRRMPPLTEVEMEESILAAAKVALRSGITSVQTLLDTLQPLYKKQPPHLHAIQRLQQQRVSYLNQTGRTDEALRLQKQLATDNPRDYAAQQGLIAEEAISAGMAEKAKEFREKGGLRP